MATRCPTRFATHRGCQRRLHRVFEALCLRTLLEDETPRQQAPISFPRPEMTPLFTNLCTYVWKSETRPVACSISQPHSRATTKHSVWGLCRRRYRRMIFSSLHNSGAESDYNQTATKPEVILFGSLRIARILSPTPSCLARHCTKILDVVKFVLM
jgi:hypothetical protein